jgi:hypothetical protein
MNLMSRLFGPKPKPVPSPIILPEEPKAPEGTVHEFQHAGNRNVKLILPHVQGGILLKRLKWVTDSSNRVGIVWELDSSGYAEVHLVGPSGETVGTYRTPAGNLKLALYEQIPEPRRVGLTRERAASLGYF